MEKEGKGGKERWENTCKINSWLRPDCIPLQSHTSSTSHPFIFLLSFLRTYPALTSLSFPLRFLIFSFSTLSLSICLFLLWSLLLVHQPCRSSLKIINRSFQYAALYLWINSPPNFVSPVRYCLLQVHLLSHMVVHLNCHHFYHVSPVLSFTLNLRLGSLANPFHHGPFPYLPDWFYGLAAHLTFLFCSTAGSVCTVC